MNEPMNEPLQAQRDQSVTDLEMAKGYESRRHSILEVAR